MSQDTDTNQLVFRHSLVRSAIDSRIGPDRRRSHHARIAEALEAHTPYRFADRARHLLAAGRVREAAPLQVMAADAALGVASYGDARELLTAAMPNLAGSERGSALCRLGLALRQLGDPRGGVDAIQRGVHLLEEAGLDREAGRERLLLGLFLFAVEGPLASEAQYRRAREQLRPYGDSEALALSEVWCGASLVVADQVEAARLDVLRGLDMAVRDGHPSVIAWAHQILGVVEAKSGRMSDGIRLLDHSYREGIELESDVLAEVALHNACVIRQIGLRAQEVESRLIAHRNPSNGANWPMLRDGVLLGALVELGDIDRGLALCESLRSRLSESGAGEMLEWADCAYVILLSDAGRSEEARSVMRGGLDGLLAQDLALRAAAHVRYLLVTGDSEAAADVVDEALKRYDADAVHHRLALAGAQAYLAAGRGTALCALREAVDRDRALQGTAWSELVAGHADLCAGQHASAQRWLAKASRKFVTGSYQLHYARCAALQGIAAGPRAGRPLLERSMATLAARHAEGVADELARLAQRLWMLIDQPPKLTVRESEVLTVLAAGHTDAEIAVALGISPRTVTSHLDRIRDKTGRRRRAELTRLAIELRIGPADGVVPPLV
jgi:DNA-binding CsgD family transcriptional regulator